MTDLPRQLIASGDSTMMTLRCDFDWFLVSLKEPFKGMERLEVSYSQSLRSRSSNQGQRSGGQVLGQMSNGMAIP